MCNSSFFSLTSLLQCDKMQDKLLLFRNVDHVDSKRAFPKEALTLKGGDSDISIVLR